MNERLDIGAVAPDGYGAVRKLEGYVRGKVDPILLLLVKIRASVLNECSFCIDTHSQEFWPS